MYPREGHLKSGGYRLHYLLWGGRGPKIVLLHSMGMDAHAYDQLSEALKEESQILAFDILDHGDSEKPKEPIGLIEHTEVMRGGYRQLGFYPNILVGHSIGGMMGMILAAEHPEEIRGLVLVDIAPFDPSRRPPRPPPPDSFRDEEEARSYLIQRYPRFTPQAIENRMRYAFIKDEAGRLRLKGTGNAIRPSLAIDLWPYVERIRVPTLLVIGSESDLVSEGAVERMRRAVPGLEVEVVEGATHMVPQDRPEEFERCIRSFIGRL